MKIVKLLSENVKRLSAVEVTPSPDGALITVGGKNGAGKSSVLDSIAWALGGERLTPSEPIRAGQREAKVVVDLGEYVVTRKFARDPAPCSCGNGDDPTHKNDCDSLHKFGPTKSTLTVSNPQGAKYPSPQALLDKLYGKLAFDPLAFVKEEPKKQTEILRRLTGLDFTLLDAQRKFAYERRGMTKRTLAIAEGKLDNMPSHPNAPQAEIPVDDVTREVNRGRLLEASVREAERKLDDVKLAGEQIKRDADAHRGLIASLEKQLEKVRKQLSECDGLAEANDARHAAAETALADARAAVPDFSVLEARLREVDATNKRVRDNIARAVQEMEVVRLRKERDADDMEIAGIDERKESALRAAKFPVTGLGLSDDGVTFEGLPFDQVSSSAQLRASVAIGLALNPELKVLLVRNGNLLDDDGLTAMAEQAAEAGAQVWVEWVTGDPADVSVMLVDGHLA
jgi:DNA repair exonuclease SbcCD ATPase subunit